MKSILVPTDFTPAAENAANYALHLARVFNTGLRLIHVYNIPVPVSTGAPITVMPMNELQQINENKLKHEAERLSEGGGITITYKAVAGGIIEEILEESEQCGLIVTGMKSSGIIKEALLGSTSTSLLSKTRKPMLIIPEGVTFKTPEKVVLACDYKEHAQIRSLYGLEDMIDTFKMKLYVVNVKKVNEIPALEEVMEEELKHETSENEPVFYFPVSKDPVEGINAFVNSKEADMVAVIPHHYKLIEGLFHQRISKKLAFHTHVPMLVLPEH